MYDDVCVRPCTKQFAPQKLANRSHEPTNASKKFIYQEVKRKIQNPGSFVELADGRQGVVQIFDMIRHEAAIFFADSGHVEHWLYNDVVAVKK